MLTGGCLCGEVRYEVAGQAFHETLCHCSICRRASGAPCVAWFSVRRTDFRVLRGTPSRFRSSPKGSRTFCARCGTQLSFELTDLPDEIDVTTCSLDEPQALAPRDHTWTSSKLPWVEFADRLPRFREARS